MPHSKLNKKKRGPIYLDLKSSRKKLFISTSLVNQTVVICWKFMIMKYATKKLLKNAFSNCLEVLELLSWKV